MMGPAVSLSSRIRRHRWLVPVAVLVLWFSTGIRTIEQNEQGVVLRFGRVVRTCPPGFHMILPWPVESMSIVRTSEVRTMKVGKPFTAADRMEDSPDVGPRWLTGDTNVVELELLLQYQIRDPVAYLYGVANLPDGRSRDYVLQKIGESVLTVLVAKADVDDVLGAGKGPLAEEARRRIQHRADEMGLGVEVLSVNVVEAVPPAEVISAFNEVTSARADRDRALSDADGYAKELLPEARAQADRITKEAEIYASQTVSEAKGEAASFLDLEAQVALSPEVSMRRLWVDAMEEALAKARKVVYPSKPGRRFHLTAVGRGPVKAKSAPPSGVRPPDTQPPDTHPSGEDAEMRAIGK